MIKVSAVNPANGEGYAYLPFKITSSKSVFMETQYKTEYEGELDENGEAAFEFRQKNSRSYSIATSSPNDDGSLSCYINDASMSFSKPETNYNFQFEYAPCAYLKLKIENVNCSGSDDIIFFKRTWLTRNTSGNGVTQEGCFSYEGDFFELPEGQYLYEWEVTRSGNTTYHDSLFYINKGDSYTFLLKY